MTMKLAMLLLAAIVLAGAIGRIARRPVGRSKTEPIEAARKCATCGVYVLGGSSACGRADCPQA